MPEAIETAGWETIYKENSFTFVAADGSKPKTPVIPCDQFHRIAIYAAVNSFGNGTYLNIQAIGCYPDGTAFAASNNLFNVGPTAHGTVGETKLLVFSREASSSSTVITNYFNLAPMFPFLYVAGGATNNGAPNVVSGNIRIFGIRRPYNARS